MKQKATAWILALALCLGLLAGCGGDGGNSGGGEGGKIDTKIILVDEDGAEYPYDLHVTEGATLREALYEAELISEDTYYAMFVDNIDGHIADVENDGATWMPCDENGEQIMGTFDEITVEAGGTIKLVYYIVPDFD